MSSPDSMSTVVVRCPCLQGFYRSVLGVQTRDREAGPGELKVQDGCACHSGSQDDRPEQKQHGVTI